MEKEEGPGPEYVGAEVEAQESSCPHEGAEGVSKLVEYMGRRLGHETEGEVGDRVQRTSLEYCAKESGLDGGDTREPAKVIFMDIIP